MAKKSKRPQGARRGRSTYRPGADPVARDTFAQGRHDPQYDFRAQLTPATARESVESAARMRYGGAEAQLADQMRGVGQRFQNVGNWFDQYKADLDKAKTAQEAYYKGAQDANAQLVQQAAAQAPVEGAQSAQQPTDSKNAASVRQGLAESFGQLLKAQLGTEQAYLGDRQAVGSAAQLSERLKSDQMMKALEREGGQLAREKGDYKTQYAGELRDKERSYADTLHRQGLERQAFGLDVEKVKQSAYDEQADRESKAQADARKRRQQVKDQRTKRRQQVADRNYKATHSKPSESSADTKRVRKVRQKSSEALGRLDDAAADYQRLKKTPWEYEEQDQAGNKIKKRRSATEQEVQAQLRKEGYSPREIRLALKPRWDQADVRMAHSLGIRVPRDKIAKPRKPSRGERYSKGGGRPD